MRVTDEAPELMRQRAQQERCIGGKGGIRRQRVGGGWASGSLQQLWAEAGTRVTTRRDAVEQRQSAGQQRETPLRQAP